MKNVTRWLAAVGICVAVAAAGFWGYQRVSAERAAELARENPTTMPSRVTQDGQGHAIVTLTAAEQSRSQIQLQLLKSRELQPQVQAFGMLREDPAESFTLRSPIAGTLRVASTQAWPGLGDVVAGGTEIGMVEPRFAPIEQVDLSSKLASAQADVQASAAALNASRADLQRVQKLNAQDKNVSDKVVQDARAVVAADEAKLAASQQTVKLIQDALAASNRTAGGTTLMLPQGGEVVEMPARPGEAVEAGQALLRVARFDSLIAAVSAAPGEDVDLKPGSAKVFVAGYDDEPLEVKRIELGPAVDPRTLAPMLLLHIDAKRLGLRPGMPVTARLPVNAQPDSGVIVPRDAVVWHEGKAWVYVQASQTQFIRREIHTDRPVEDGYFVTAGVRAGQNVVTRGAQQLLSEEFKPALPAGGEEGDND